MARQDPLRNYRFRVEIDGIQAGGFSEVFIEPTTTEVIEYREGSDPSNVRKLVGLTKFGNVTLKRGVSASLELFNWHLQVVRGQISSARRNGVWSQINREHIARLTAAGRMTPHGQRQVDAAKADGRWDAAYAPTAALSRRKKPAS